MAQAGDKTVEQLDNVVDDGGLVGTDLFYLFRSGTPDKDYKLAASVLRTFVLTALSITLTQVSDAGDLAALDTIDTAHIAASAVTNAKMSTMPAATFKANLTGAAAVPTDATAGQIKTALAIDVGDVSGLGSMATQSASAFAALATPNVFTAQQNFASNALTDGASIAWNLNTQQAAHVTIGGNRTLANPTNMVNGGTYVLRVVQDGTGTRTLAYGANYTWPGGNIPVLSTAAGAVDVLTFLSDGVNMYGSIQKAFA